MALNDSTMQMRHILGNGTFDAAYASALVQFNGANGYSLCCGGIALKAHAGGGLLIRGNFYKVNGQPRRYLARLNADGTLNTQFAPPTNAVWQLPPVRGGSAAGLRDTYGLANGQTLVLWNDTIRSYLVESIKKCGALPISGQYWHNWSDCFPPLEPLLITA